MNTIRIFLKKLQFNQSNFSDDLKALPRHQNLNFNCDDIIGLCKFMIRDHKGLRAFYFLKKLPDIYRCFGSCTSSDASNFLGLALCVYKKVVFCLPKTKINCYVSCKRSRFPVFFWYFPSAFLSIKKKIIIK